MGRPAFSWRVTPGDHGTEGSEDPPTMVTAPSGAISTQRCPTKHWDPKRTWSSSWPALSDRQDHQQMLHNKRQHTDPEQKTEYEGTINQQGDHSIPLLP